MASVAVELPFVAAHYGIPESTLTSLSRSPTTELVNQLLESLTSKAREYDGLRSDKLRLEVELENAVRSNESKIKVLKNNVEKGLKEISQLRSKLQESETSRSNLETEIATLKSSSTSNESEVNGLKSRIASLESSNRDTMALLDSKSSAYDKLTEDFSVQHKKTIDLRHDLTTAEQNLQAAQSASSTARFREQSLQQELDLVKKNNEWLENELKTKSAEYLKFRKEKGTRVSELQREIEEASAATDSLRRSENALKNRLEEVQQKYEDSAAAVQQLKEEAIQNAEQVRFELDNTNRLAQLREAAAETAKQRAQECQLALEKAKDDAAEEISRLRVDIEAEHADKEAAERRIAELEMTVNQLQSEATAGSVSPGLALNGAGATTPLRPGTPTSTFSPRASRMKGGLTLTQMYTEYDKMRTMLLAEQKNNQELKSTLDEMVQDLESSKPEIDELRADHARLENAVVEMSTILENSGKERDEATREARKWRGQVEGLAKEGEILRQQLRDLSAEVKVLVLEAALLKEGENDYDRGDLEKIARNEIDEMSADLNATGKFITRNLTTFKNLHELQEQNVTLRRMLRELGDRMEGEEARQKSAIHHQEQEELKELRIRVQTYRDEITNLTAQTKSYVKERDTFRSMLMRRRQTIGGDFSQSLPLDSLPPTGTAGQLRDTTDYADLLRKVQAHFDAFRQETATDHSALKQQVNELSRRNSELQSSLSRSESQLSAAVQRTELLHNNFNMLKNENMELQKRYSTLMENATRQDMKTQQAAEDLVDAKGLADSLRRENANLKAEKDLWKSIEKRLVEDNESLRNERSRLDSLNASLQNILNEREHADAESRRRLQLSVESLETELQSTKRKLNEESEDAKRATLRREYDHEQNQKRIDDLVTSLSSVREELIATKTTRDHLQSRVDELTVELRSAEERLQVLQTKPAATAVSAGTAEVSAGEGEPSGLTKEQELSLEASELKRDLELARGELDHAKEQVEDYKAISQATEERLQSVTETQDQYREEMDHLVEEKEKKIQDLEQRITEISAELSTTNTELSRLHDEHGDIARRVEDQKAMYESEVTRLKDEAERHIAAAQFYQEDIKAQAEIAQHAQQNYENELLKHAEAAKTLQIVRTEANKLRIELAELNTGAVNVKKDLAQKEESWSETKDRYEREILELQKRREEVLHQNNLLHNQLENITKQISSLQKDRANIHDEESEGTNTSLESLQEVIKFLRREKEIVDVQYHLSTQEGKRLRQQLDYTQAQLDETRLKLEQQRRAVADSDNNTLNHNKLMETLNELNLFRESSVTLRNQAKQAETALIEKSAHVEELTQQIEPLQTRIRELENAVEMKDEEMKLIQADRDRWQQRTENILHKYDRIDPADMEALQEKIATLGKEREEADSVRDSLQVQVMSFPDLLKQAEDRTQELRQKLTEQFKARSKELTGRINAKQGELNAAIQEKEVIQEELRVTREELEQLKSSLTDTPAHAPEVTEGGMEVDNVTTTEMPVQATTLSEPSHNNKIQELEAKIQRLEAALTEKDTQFEAKVKERSDKLKEQFNNKLIEFRKAQQQELQKFKQQEQTSRTPQPETPQTPQNPTDTPQKTDNGTTTPKGVDLSELTETQARELVLKNSVVNNIVRNNIRAQVAKERERLEAQHQAALAAAGSNTETIADLEKKHSEELAALKKKYDENTEEKVRAAVELADKRSLARISMLETRFKTSQAKLDVVQKAAEENPQRPVAEVWAVAKTAKATPTPQTPRPTQKPGEVQSTPQVAPTSTPAGTPVKPPASQPSTEQQASAIVADQAPSPAPPASVPPPRQSSQTQPKLQNNLTTEPTPLPAANQSQLPPNPFGQLQQSQQAQVQEVGALPGKAPTGGIGNHPNAGSGLNALRALQSGLPVSRGRGGGRGGGQVHNPFGSHTTDQHQPQLPSQAQQTSPSVQRGSGLPRGRGGRVGAGRGVQHLSTNAAPQTQGQEQASPSANRGALNAAARQFVPQSNKRAREDGVEAASDVGANAGKRIRGGGINRGT